MSCCQFHNIAVVLTTPASELICLSMTVSVRQCPSNRDSIDILPSLSPGVFLMQLGFVLEDLCACIFVGSSGFGSVVVGVTLSPGISGAQCTFWSVVR